MDFVVCVGLCWARVGTILGLSWFIFTHFSVVEFSSMQHVRKTYHKYQESNNFWGALLMVFAVIFWLFVFLSFVHAALRLCLPDLKLMGGHGACANPIFDDGKCWNSAGS